MGRNPHIEVYTMKPYKYAVFIGRLSPMHIGHVENIKHGLSLADEIIILLGSPNVPLSPTNPFSVDARTRIIEATLADNNISQYTIDTVQDTVSMKEWINNVDAAIKRHTSDSVVIVGCNKDSSSYYLRAFDYHYDVNLIDTVQDESLSATTIRAALYRGDFESFRNIVSPSAYDIIIEEYRLVSEVIRSDISACSNYRKNRSQYPIIDVAADAIVICGDRVLLISRGKSPGKGLLAIPGGFLEPQEKWADCAIRELFEETGMVCSNPVLNFVASDPARSSRSRIITNVFVFSVNTVEGELPYVKGSDDASSAFWFGIDQLLDYNTKALFFEDHYSLLIEGIAKYAKQAIDSNLEFDFSHNFINMI